MTTSLIPAAFNSRAAPNPAMPAPIIITEHFCGFVTGRPREEFLKNRCDKGLRDQFSQAVSQPVSLLFF